MLAAVAVAQQSMFYWPFGSASGSGRQMQARTYWPETRQWFQDGSKFRAPAFMVSPFRNSFPTSEDDDDAQDFYDRAVPTKAYWKQTTFCIQIFVIVSTGWRRWGTTTGRTQSGVCTPSQLSQQQLGATKLFPQDQIGNNIHDYLQHHCDSYIGRCFLLHSYVAFLFIKNIIYYAQCTNNYNNILFEKMKRRVCLRLDPVLFLVVDEDVDNWKKNL